MLKPSQVKDHARFADRVLRVSNVPMTGGERSSVFVVLMGAAGYVQAYNGLRRHPNVVFEADVRKGPNLDQCYGSFILGCGIPCILGKRILIFLHV